MVGLNADGRELFQLVLIPAISVCPAEVHVSIFSWVILPFFCYTLINFVIETFHLISFLTRPAVLAIS